MTFKEMLATDAKNVFVNTDEIGEEITYTPNGSDPVTIDAVVVREKLETQAADGGRTTQKTAEIYIVNDATEGVTSIDKNDDRITLTDKNGNSVTARIAEILSSDDGMWHLALSW